MDNNVKCTVIILTYNPEYKKLIRTIESVIRQKDIIFDIVISDDGSKKSYKEEVISYINKKSNVSYKYIENKENKGTVLNCLQAVNQSVGEYIYIISPGDFFFDEYVLRDLYSFAIEKNADFCFGKAQCYSFNNNNLELYNVHFPKSPRVYSKNYKNKTIPIVSFFWGQLVVGASYFRKRSVMKKYLELIANKVKYVEDTTTSYIYMIAENKQLYFLDKYTVWYEYKTGISTSENPVWEERINKDWKATENILKSKFENNPIVDAKYIKNKVLKIIKHPIISAIVIFDKLKVYLLADNSVLSGSNDFFDDIIKIEQ